MIHTGPRLCVVFLGHHTHQTQLTGRFLIVHSKIVVEQESIFIYILRKNDNDFMFWHIKSSERPFVCSLLSEHRIQPISLIIMWPINSVVL